MISMIAAIGRKNRELGFKNDLPWHIPEDMRRYKEKTLGHPIIMGRKTYDSLGKPLPKRYNIVITRKGRKEKSKEYDNLEFVNTVEEALEAAKGKEGDEEIFIIGGGEIFKIGMKYANKLYLTLVDGGFEADTFFPPYDEFKKVVYKRDSQDENYSYTFLDLERL